MAPSASAELLSLSASELQLSLGIPEGAIASVSWPERRLAQNVYRQARRTRHPTSGRYTAQGERKERKLKERSGFVIMYAIRTRSGQICFIISP